MLAELVTEIFTDVIVNGLVLFPGTFIRWIFLHRKKTYKTLLSEDMSYTVGILFAVFATLSIIAITNYI